VRLRLASFQIWLLAAMLIAGTVGVVGGRFVIARIQHNEEETADRAKDERIARGIAARVAAGAGLEQLQARPSSLRCRTTRSSCTGMGRRSS
jgi:hypothetical protein